MILKTLVYIYKSFISFSIISSYYFFRTFNRISTDGETESPVDYDELKNIVIDIQLSAKEFRKSLKHVKSDDPKYEKILLDLKRHLKEDLHVHVNKLNTVRKEFAKISMIYNNYFVYSREQYV